MTQQTINVGAAPNDGTGDPARTAFQKANANFTELYQPLAQTAYETAVSAVVVQACYPPGVVDRYGVNTTPGTTDMGPALQAAINVALATSGSAKVGTPIRFLAGAYSIATAPTFGSSTMTLLPIDIGGQGAATQVINNITASTAATFDFTAKNGWYLHDLWMLGNSAHKNTGIVCGTTSAAEQIRWRIERIALFMAGVGIKVADSNTGVIRDVRCWPDNPGQPMIVPQTVINSDINHHVWLTGGFCNDISIYDLDASPSINYATNSRSILIDATNAVNCRIYGGQFGGETSTNAEVSLQLGAALNHLYGMVVVGAYHENSKVVISNCTNGTFIGLANGSVGGGITVQTNSVNNTFLNCSQIVAGGGITFDSSSLYNTVIGGSYVSVTDSATTPNAFLAANGSANLQAAAFVPSGSTAPTNGVYKPATNVVAVATNSTEAWRVDASQNLVVGATAAVNSTHTIKKAVGQGSYSFSISSTAGTDIVCEGGDGALPSSDAIIRVAKQTTGSYSIKATGSITASSADYAEYEYKNAACPDIVKGQIIGFDTDGKLTNRWSVAIRFGVKSTEPAYVGGNAWSDPETIGKRPAYPERTDSDTDETFAAKVSEFNTADAAFKVAMEAERVKVDRIAYAGKVPCNVTGAAPGQYIIAVAATDGTIAGEAVASPTFDQYRNAIGRVNRILPDGRAEIAVMVH